MIVLAGIEGMKFEKLLKEVIKLPCLSVMDVNEFLSCLIS